MFTSATPRGAQHRGMKQPADQTACLERGVGTPRPSVATNAVAIRNGRTTGIRSPWRPHRSSGLTRLAMVATDLLNNWHNLVSRRGALMRLSKLPRALFPLMCCLATFVFLVV